MYVYTYHLNLHSYLHVCMQVAIFSGMQWVDNYFKQKDSDQIKSVYIVQVDRVL